MDFNEQQKAYLERIEAGLKQYTPGPEHKPTRLHEAMRYAIEAGGKRVRPTLLLAAFDACGKAGDPLPAAVAVECLHTYSLIHDDLPCMDNDDLRRGRPTVHKAFDEPTALLAGDALLTYPFLLIASAYRNQPNLAVSLTIELADAASSRRLIGGQMADILAERNKAPTQDELDYIHLNKTAAMIEVSLIMGGIIGGGNAVIATMLRKIGRDIGMAFQIIDDILDATADSATLGKTAGKDKNADKLTYVKYFGVAKAREKAFMLTQRAIGTLNGLPGDTSFLEKYFAHLADRAK